MSVKMKVRTSEFVLTSSEVVVKDGVTFANMSVVKKHVL